MQRDSPICNNCNMKFPNMQELLIHKHSCRINKTINTVLPAASNFQFTPYSNFPTAAHASSNQFKINLQSTMKCRYDNVIIQEVNKSQFPNVCSNSECINEYQLKCKLLLKCGHECYSLERDDCNIISCLHLNCKNYKKLFDQDKNSLCPICLTDELNIYPLLKLPCGFHLVHKRCLETRLKIKWSGKEISFNYLKCPVCNFMPENSSKINFTKNKEILNLYNQGLDLFNVVQNLGKKFYDEQKNNLSNFEIDKLSFYLCDKCSNPFCAGLKECVNIDDEEDKKFCIDCFDYTKIKGITNCEIHGRKSIQYKCKFCCNISSHFCFGTTHFCEDCHMLQLKGDYLTTKSLDELPKCPGKENCPLNIDHPPNGEEFGICCLLCLK
jgi:hypothetical protein